MARYTTIAGEFHIHYPDIPRSGPQPDGDTVTFLPDNPDLVEDLEWFGDKPPKFNGRGMISVRFEGIDTLETHFPVGPVQTHQESLGAYAARDFMLAQFGFTSIVFFPDKPDVVQSVGNHPRRGHLVANGVDSNRRVLAFVYPGNPTGPEGNTFLDIAQMKNSVNWKLVDQGLAYTELYTTLPIDLANALRVKAADVRTAKLGIFARETLNTQTAATIPHLAALEQLVIFPKLFRRMAAYFLDDFPDLSEFDSWLRDDPVNRDDRVLLPTGELGNMHDIFELLSDDQMRLTYEPESLTILPDDA